MQRGKDKETQRDRGEEVRKRGVKEGGREWDEDEKRKRRE